MSTYDELQNFYKAQTARDPWAVAWAIVGGGKNPKPVSPKLAAVRELYADEIASAGDDVEARKSLAAKIAGGIENNPFNKSMDSKDLKKLSPFGAAIAGWWFGGDVTRGLGEPTPAQQREFERQVQNAMRRKTRSMKKDSAMNKMEAFFKNDSSDTYVRKTPVKNGVTANSEPMDPILKIMSLPPFQGARFDPTSHRWVKPENVGATYAARGGKKRIRGSGTGAHARSVSGHGKGRIREEGAGRKNKGETDLAAQRRKEGFSHGKFKVPTTTNPDSEKRRKRHYG